MTIIELHFDKERHIYTFRGNAIPSVTHIMRFMSRELYDGIPADVLMKAADRGTRVHALTEDYDTYGFCEAEEDTNAYIQAYEKFKSDFKPEWTGIEVRLYHKNLLYAGTVDRVGFVTPEDGTGLDIVDLKATRVFHPVMLQTQVSAYGEMYKSHGLAIRNIYGLQLKPDGSYLFQKLKYDFKTFLHCLALHNEMAKEQKA